MAWSGTGITGGIGRAVAPGHLLGLDTPGMRPAIGIARSQAAGFRAMQIDACLDLHRKHDLDRHGSPRSRCRRPPGCDCAVQQPEPEGRDAGPCQPTSLVRGRVHPRHGANRLTRSACSRCWTSNLVPPPGVPERDVNARSSIDGNFDTWSRNAKFRSITTGQTRASRVYYMYYERRTLMQLFRLART
jgi:hypothetical protein